MFIYVRSSIFIILKFFLNFSDHSSNFLLNFVYFFLKSFQNIDFGDFYLVIILMFLLLNIHIINFEIPQIF